MPYLAPRPIISETDNEDEYGSAFESPSDFPVGSPGGGSPAANAEAPAPNTDDEVSSGASHHSPAAKGLSVKAVRAGDLVYPKSCYSGYEPPLPESSEGLAVAELLEEADGQADTSYDDCEFKELLLDEFLIYLPGKLAHRGFQLVSLHDLATGDGKSLFYFDGILSVGNSKRYVQGVPFKICQIGNYGKDRHTHGGKIWIQSQLRGDEDVFYRLGEPSPEYQRYHSGFLWLADLAKHFVDFAEEMVDGGSSVTTNTLCREFYDWLVKEHGSNEAFNRWFQAYGKKDFRHAVSANIDWIYKESVGVYPRLEKEPIFDELLRKTAVPERRLVHQKTSVTQYVYTCFKHIQFADQLEVVTPSDKAKAKQKAHGKRLHLTVDASRSPTPSRSSSKLQGDESPAPRNGRSIDLSSIKTGDVIAVPPDGSNSKWKTEKSKWRPDNEDEIWYAYVLGERPTKAKTRTFDVIWLYKPSETICNNMPYPHSHELFFSENCTCLHKSRDEESPGIKEDEIMSKVSITWFSSPDTCKTDFFVRQTYLVSNVFVTFQESHKACAHSPKRPVSVDATREYRIGDTVLVHPPVSEESRLLEPREIVGFRGTGTKDRVTLRRLLRRTEVDPESHSRPNELVYTDDCYELAADRIERRCLVRFYSPEDVGENIPAPYNRDGTGDAFYITTRLDKEKRLMPIGDEVPPSLIQGFDPKAEPPKRKLRGLDLFCGGGSFGRGLEEGGAVHNEWAVDFNTNAIHTYHANLASPSDTKLYLESVDDFLYKAMEGTANYPLPGDVEAIWAGSPCTGFSNLNSKKENDSSQKNQSLIASVAAYVDFFRPKYAILENVLAMSNKEKRDEDILSQMNCTFVGMGYQVNVVLIDAWSHGSAQTRNRLFILIAAPGMEPLRKPPLSHSHPSTVRRHALGRMSYGVEFGEREFAETPFRFVTAEEAVEDLPDIGDGTAPCIRYPDHMVRVTNLLRSQFLAIPRYPRGLNFWLAFSQGYMTAGERTLFPDRTKTGAIPQRVQKGSSAWGRIDCCYLFPTIAAKCMPADGYSGKMLHWDQPRRITVMEVRRAQSFPDEELITGKTSDEQWKIVGNSVARTVALALGLSLRKAWLKEPSSLPSAAVQRVAEVQENNPPGGAVVHRGSKEAQPCARAPKSRSGGLSMVSKLSHADKDGTSESDAQYRSTLKKQVLLSSHDDDEEAATSASSSMQPRKRKPSASPKAARRPLQRLRVEREDVRNSKSRSGTPARPGATGRIVKQKKAQADDDDDENDEEAEDEEVDSDISETIESYFTIEARRPRNGRPTTVGRWSRRFPRCQPPVNNGHEPIDDESVDDEPIDDEPIDDEPIVISDDEDADDEGFAFEFT